MPKPKKSAKDMAFDRERVRLHAIIQKKDQEILELTRERNMYKASAESWENTARILESKLGIPTEEILASIEREKKLEKLLANPFAVLSEGFFK
jgi:hypothetical protein